MKKIIRYIKNTILFFTRKILFLSDYRLFKQKNKNGRFELNWKDRYPCLNDNTKVTAFDRHYVYHTAWAARIISDIKPVQHIDLSSFLYFSTICSAFTPVYFFDYRPAKIKLKGLKTGKADILNLPFADNSIHSMSCMHVVEHIGLGRYGDTINPEGDLQAISELKRVVSGNGNLLFVVPVGKPKIMFNAHRIYSYDQIVQYFNGFHLIEFTLISDSSSGGLITNASRSDADSQVYGCGCFWFQKGSNNE